MGCVSSTLLSQDDDFTHIGASASAAFTHHIVSLKSTTYGLLTLDSPPSTPSTTPPPTTTIAPTPPPRFTLASLSSSDLRHLKPDEIINSWELMAGLDSSTPPLLSVPDSNRTFLPFSPLPPKPNKENSNPNLILSLPPSNILLVSDFEKLSPPDGENKVVIYTTTLRGIRKTFEACNAVRSAIQGIGVLVCERDISMDRGFREELRQLLKNKGETELIPPRVFVKGRYIGGVDEFMRIAEEDGLGNLLQGLPKLKAGGQVCDGCGGVRFLPCFKCNGSCKMVKSVAGEEGRTVVIRCSDCNENGLVLCPVCS